MKSQSAKRYPPELRERAVKMLLEHRDAMPHRLPSQLSSRVDDGNRRAAEVYKELFTGTVLLAH